MEGNRDEAEKCVEIAREALNAGNREKAQRFLQKAEKLYPLPSARGEALGPFPPRPVPGPPRSPPPPPPSPLMEPRSPPPAGPRRSDTQNAPHRHTPARALNIRAGPAVGSPRLPPHRPTCEMPALSHPARVASSPIGFPECPAVILPGDSSGPALPDGALYLDVWLCDHPPPPPSSSAIKA